MRFYLLLIFSSIFLLGCTQTQPVFDDSLIYKGDICEVVTADDVGRICGGTYDSGQSIWVYETKQVLIGCSYPLRVFNAPTYGYVSINQYNISTLNNTLELFDESYRVNYSYPPYDKVKVVQKNLSNYTLIMANYSYKSNHTDSISNTVAITSINKVQVFLYPRFASPGDLRHFDIQNEGIGAQPPCNEREVEQLAELIVRRIG